MAAPMSKPPGNKTILINKVEKHYSNSSLGAVALSCPSSSEEDLSSPDPNEPPEDPSDKVQKAAIKGDWQMV